MFRNGHIQTLAGTYLYAPWEGRRPFVANNVSTTGEVPLIDGDRLVYHDDCPAEWKSGDRVALLLHGLTGSHTSPYMSRVGRKLNDQGVRTFRLDWRGCGAGTALARFPYHSGRSDDVFATIAEIKVRCPDSPICVIGFSMGGNIALKLLGERVNDAEIDRSIAICPPIDLSTTVKSLWKGLARLYDRYFTKACIRDVRNRYQLRPDAIIPEGWFSRLPKTMYEFDDSFTAPVCGFASAMDYYAKSSAHQFLPEVKASTLIIAAQDDPVIPFGQFVVAQYSPTTQLLAPKHGGHIGFVTPRGLGWLDQQIVDWTIRGNVSA